MSCLDVKAAESWLLCRACVCVCVYLPAQLRRWWWPQRWPRRRTARRSSARTRRCWAWRAAGSVWTRRTWAGWDRAETTTWGWTAAWTGCTPGRTPARQETETGSEGPVYQTDLSLFSMFTTDGHEVPQSSVFGPVLVLCASFSSYQNVHFYADDTSLKTSNTGRVFNTLEHP